MTPSDLEGNLRKKQKEVKIDLNAHAAYSFVSESFRYLAAIRKHVLMPNEDDFKSWEKGKRRGVASDQVL